MKYIFLFIVVDIFIVWFSYYQLTEKNQQFADKLVLFEQKQAENKVFALINDADSLEKLNFKVENKYYDLKVCTLKFQRAEGLLNRAREVQKELVKPKEMPYIRETPGVVEEKEEIHPLALSLLKEAIELYKNCKEECDKLVENEDIDFNFALNYLKGEIYFRNLELLATPETMKELFEQTIGSFKNALKAKPRDIDTIVNIELLLKNSEKLLAMMNRPSVRLNQMLKPRAGQGKYRGN